MIINAVWILVKKGHEADFIAATKKNYEGSIREPGILRFDFAQDEKDGRRFFLYEVFTSDDAIMAHRETAHYKTWKEVATPWMEEPRKATRYLPVVPATPNGFKS